MQYDLKPCPFCGGEAVIQENYKIYVKQNVQKVALVMCKECFAKSRGILLSKYGKTSHSRQAERDAVRLWNRRVGYESETK